MRTTLGKLRMSIRHALLEHYIETMFVDRNVMTPREADREQLGSLASGTPVDVDPEDGVPMHLKSPDEDPEDCYGPVPPVAEDPYVQLDPLTKDIGPHTHPQISR